ncbi:hypothetical protein ACOSQ4_023814 [Xanthoceras sorbifolium]
MLDIMLPGPEATFLKQSLIWLIGIVGRDEFATVKFTNEGVWLLVQHQNQSIALIELKRDCFSYFKIDSEYGLSGRVNIGQFLIAIQAAGVEDYIGMLVTSPIFVNLQLKRFGPLNFSPLRFMFFGQIEIKLSDPCIYR